MSKKKTSLTNKAQEGKVSLCCLLLPGSGVPPLFGARLGVCVLTRREGDTSSALELASLVTSEPAPTLSPSPFGAHTQEAAGYGPALAATLTSTLLPEPPPTLPPSSPLPAAPAPALSRKGSPERARAPAQPPPPAPSLPLAVQARTSTSPTEPAETN